MCICALLHFNCESFTETKHDLYNINMLIPNESYREAYNNLAKHKFFFNIGHIAALIYRKCKNFNR